MEVQITITAVVRAACMTTSRWSPCDILIHTKHAMPLSQFIKANFDLKLRNKFLHVPLDDYHMHRTAITHRGLRVRWAWSGPAPPV